MMVIYNTGETGTKLPDKVSVNSYWIIQVIQVMQIQNAESREPVIWRHLQIYFSCHMVLIEFYLWPPYLQHITVAKLLMVMPPFRHRTLSVCLSVCLSLNSLVWLSWTLTARQNQSKKNTTCIPADYKFGLPCFLSL